MKQEIASHRFSKYYSDPEIHLFEQIWANKKGLMSEEEYKTEALFFRKQIEANQYKLVLADLRDFNFIIVPELQAWVEQHITTKLAQIIEKIAFILPKDIITVVAVEQTLDTETGLREKKKIAYFSDTESAKKWLLK